MGEAHECDRPIVSTTRVGADDRFFPRHYPGQRPEVLWIGCECSFGWREGRGRALLPRRAALTPKRWLLTVGSDARVPETMIMGSQPGDIFVHRGIANLYTPADDSLNAVLMIALINFKVKHVIVAVSFVRRVWPCPRRQAGQVEGRGGGGSGGKRGRGGGRGRERLASCGRGLWVACSNPYPPQVDPAELESQTCKRRLQYERGFL